MKYTSIVSRFCLKCYKTTRHFRGENDEEVEYACIKCDTVERLPKIPRIVSKIINDFRN